MSTLHTRNRGRRFSEGGFPRVFSIVVRWPLVSGEALVVGRPTAANDVWQIRGADHQAVPSGPSSPQLVGTATLQGPTARFSSWDEPYSGGDKMKDSATNGALCLLVLSGSRQLEDLPTCGIKKSSGVATIAVICAAQWPSFSYTKPFYAGMLSLGDLLPLLLIPAFTTHGLEDAKRGSSTPYGAANGI